MAPCEFQHKKDRGMELIASANSGNLHVPFIDRPSQERKREVSIIKSPNYSEVSDAVREAIYLLGGIQRFCRSGDVVVIKPNAVFTQPWEMAETTHPAVMAEVMLACPPKIDPPLMRDSCKITTGGNRGENKKVFGGAGISDSPGG